MNQLPRLVLFLSVGESLMSQISELQKFTSLIIFLQIILVWTLFAFSVQPCFTFLLQKTSRLACILQDVSPVLRFYEKKPFSVAILPPPPPPSLLAGWTINPSVCRRLARGSHLAHHSGRWRASISGSLLSQNLKHPPSKRRPKCCQQTVLHSLQTPPFACLLTKITIPNKWFSYHTQT